MPKGVEHQPTDVRFNIVFDAKGSVMPKGVEHLQDLLNKRLRDLAKGSVMPKGVEHEEGPDEANLMTTRIDQ